MKKIILVMVMLLCGFAGYADYTGTVTTATTDLSFSTKKGYNVVSLSSGTYNTQVGAPQLPVKTLSFLIPIDQKVSSINIIGTSSVSVAGSYTMFPVQPPIANDTLAFINPDTSIYHHSAPYPSALYQISNDGYPMGYHVVTITFNPLQYSPTSHSLKLYTSINFTIVYTANTANILVPNLQSLFSNNIAKSHIQSMVVNPSDITIVTGGARQVSGSTTSVANLRGMAPTVLTGVPDYIIITRSDLVSSFQTLANWKTQKGVNTLVVQTDGTNGIFNNYGGYDDAEKIRNYLKDAYKNFGCVFVLLGGDVTDNNYGNGSELIPARFTPILSNSLYESDFYYATVQGNWNANSNGTFGEYSELTNAETSNVFFVGRAPSHNVTEATLFCNKIIRYENLKDGSNVALTNPSYVNNLSFWTNNTNMYGPPGPGLDALVTGGTLPTSTYHVLDLYEPAAAGSYQLNQSNALSVLNTGLTSFGGSGNVHIVYHEDHSGYDCIGVPSGTPNHQSAECIGQTDMDNLTNGFYYNIIYTDGCNPNEFAKNALSKHYINNPNGGGVALLGNTDEGYQDNAAYFRQYFVPMLYGTGVVNGLASYNNTRYHIGYLNNYSSASIVYRSKDRNLLGDPEMMVWSNTPQSLTVSSLAYSSYSKQITGTVSGLLSASTLIVTVTVWKGTEIWSTQDITSTSSSFNFTFSNVFADTPGNITVTVNAHNYIPNVNTINVASPISGGHPYMTGNTIEDGIGGYGTGNGDGYPDAGETIALPITLTNSGNATASNVTATLSWTALSFQSGTMVTFGTSSASFGNITAGGTANNNTAPFTFTIDKNVFTNGISPRLLNQFVNLTLNVSVNGTAFSTKSFAIEIGEPNIVMGENTVTGTPTVLGAGSSNQLVIKLYNMGASQATGLSATLTNGSSNVAITNATSTYANMNAVDNNPNYGTNSSTFNFNLGTAYTISQTFGLTVTNTFGQTWTFPSFYLSPFKVNFTYSTQASVTSLNINWTCAVVSPSGDAILGYNLKRRLTSVGNAYTKVNTDLIPYSAYLDQGLAQLKSYDYQLTAVDVSGNESLPYFFTSSTSLPYHTGWPVTPSVNINITGSKIEGSPNVYDLYDGTNGVQTNKEIIFTSGDGVGGIWAFNNDASRWYSFDGNHTNESGYINLGVGTSATPLIADIDNDGMAELAVTTHNGSTNSQKLLAYKSIDANNVAPVNQNATNFPSATSISGWEVMKGAVTADLNKDGMLELLVSSFGGGLQVFNQDGTPYTPWTASTIGSCGYSTPVAFDFDNDDKKEIVIGCTGTNTSGANAGLYVFKQDGTPYTTNPVYTPVSGYRCDFPPAVADLDNDGYYEIIFISANGYTANIYAYSIHSGALITGWNATSHPTLTLRTSVTTNSDADHYGGQFCPTLSIGDLNKDGYPEVVCGDAGSFYVWGHGGTSTPITTYPYIASGSMQAVTYQTPILADIDTDPSDLEVIFNAVSPSSNTNIYAFKANSSTGTGIVGFPMYIPEGAGNSPCVGNIDDHDNPNNQNELIVTTVGRFYAWDSHGDASNNIYGWNSYRKDNYNSGVYFDMADGYLYDEDIYLQNKTNIGSSSTNHNRYYFGRNVSVGSSVTGKITSGSISFDATSNITIEATKGVLLQADIAIPVGCTFEIK